MADEQQGALSVREFLNKAGWNEPLSPGEIAYKRVSNEDESEQFTVAYDWSNPDIVRVEVRPGLSGEMPPPEELYKFAIWLQTENYLELNLSDNNDEQ